MTRHRHLRRGGGEQFTAAFRALNPLALVPVLEDGELRLTQSLAILEYLEEAHPTPALLPRAASDRALCELSRCRSLAICIHSTTCECSTI